MKKTLIFILAAVLLFSSTACGNNPELEQLWKENEELKKQISVSENTSSEKDAEASTSEQTLSISQPLTVNTSSGSYKITVTGAEIKDWRERSRGNIKNLNVMLNYTVENIDFKNEYYTGCNVDSSLFYVYDDNNTLLDTASSSYDTQFPDNVLPGRNGQFNLCYDLIKDDTKYIDVVLHRIDEQGKDTILGQTRISLEN